jgi:glycosyltransferase domain-containing protein
MNESLLQKLTIVIFTYNRHKYLKLIIKYWSNYNVKLLILDGSDVKFEDLCLNTKNIKYIYNQKGIYDRLLTCIDYIDTEFMILSCDDEFYLPSALSSCIKFLTEEPSFSSCGGLAVAFLTEGKDIKGKIEYPEFKNFCLNDDNASERISKHFSNYAPAHIFSVMRSSKRKIITKFVAEKEYSFYAVGEYQTEFLAIISGKSKMIPELMWMRNRQSKPIRGTNPSNSYSVMMYQWWYSKLYKKEKKEFLYRLKNACEELLTDQNIEFTEDKIAKLFEIFIYNIWGNEKKTFFKKVKILIPIELKKLLKFFKTFLYNVISVDTIRTSHINGYKNLLDEVDLLKTEGISVNHKELNQIILAIQSFK